MWGGGADPSLGPRFLPPEVLDLQSPAPQGCRTYVPTVISPNDTPLDGGMLRALGCSPPVPPPSTDVIEVWDMPNQLSTAKRYQSPLPQNHCPTGRDATVTATDNVTLLAFIGDGWCDNNVAILDDDAGVSFQPLDDTTVNYDSSAANLTTDIQYDDAAQDGGGSHPSVPLTPSPAGTSGESLNVSLGHMSGDTIRMPSQWYSSNDVLQGEAALLDSTYCPVTTMVGLVPEETPTGIPAVLPLRGQSDG